MASRILNEAPVGSLLKLNGKRKRRPNQARKEDAGHLAFVRQLPCVVSGQRPVEAAHVRFASSQWGKPVTGTGVKPDDRWTVPLHPDVHREQHSMGELQFWKAKGIDPLVVAARLWEVSGDLDAGRLVIRQVRGAG